MSPISRNVSSAVNLAAVSKCKTRLGSNLRVHCVSHSPILQDAKSFVVDSSGKIGERANKILGCMNERMLTGVRGISICAQGRKESRGISSPCSPVFNSCPGRQGKQKRVLYFPLFPATRQTSARGKQLMGMAMNSSYAITHLFEP